MEGRTIGQLFHEMKRARQDWELALKELMLAQELSVQIPSVEGDLALRKARGREVEATQEYLRAVREYATAVRGSG